MYRVRQMDIDDKVCEQVSMTLLNEVYPQEVIERCLSHSELWASKERRVRGSTGLALVWLVIGLALWSRLNQCQGWHKRVGKLSMLHLAVPRGQGSDGLWGRRKALGSQGLQTLMRERSQPLAQREGMPTAFFGRYRLMAGDGSVFNPADPEANEQAFGRSSNQYGKGAYPQGRCVLRCQAGSQAVVDLSMDRYDISEGHGAHRLLRQIGPPMLVLLDAGSTSAGFFEHVRRQRSHALGALQAGAWEHLPTQRRLVDGSVVAWVPPRRHVPYPSQQGMWVRIISYRVTDERVEGTG